MYKPETMDLDALLRDTAAHDNAALPFAQWKAELLKNAAEDTATLAPLPFAPPASGGRKRLLRVTGGLAAAAAAVLILLNVNLNGAPPAPQSAAPESRLMSEASISGETPAEVPAPAAAAPEAAMPEIAMDMAEAAPEAAPQDAPQAAPEAGPEMYAGAPEGDAGYIGREAEAVNAVTAYLAARVNVAPGSGSTTGAGDTTQEAAAVIEYDREYTVRMGEGMETAKVRMVAAYVVTLPNGSRYLVDAADMRVAGEILGEPAVQAE